MKRAERKERKAETWAFGEGQDLIRRFRCYMKKHDLTIEQATELRQLVSDFYEYGVKFPEISQRAESIGHTPYSPRAGLEMLLGANLQMHIIKLSKKSYNE